MRASLTYLCIKKTIYFDNFSRLAIAYASRNPENYVNLDVHFKPIKPTKQVLLLTVMEA